MELVTYSDADLALTEALECDPEMMRELGGPVSREDALKAHRRRVENIAKDPWWFKIIPEPGGEPAGTLGIWESEWRGSAIHEVGWMVLPAFQGRGIATAALGLLLSRARAEPRFDRVHAFPGVSNAPSNALCRRFGFRHVDVTEVEFRGRPLKVNHWECDLGRTD